MNRLHIDEIELHKLLTKLNAIEGSERGNCGYHIKGRDFNRLRSTALHRTVKNSIVKNNRFEDITFSNARLSGIYT